MGRFFLYNKNNTKRSNYVNNNHFNIYHYITDNTYYCLSTLASNNSCWTARYYKESVFGTMNVEQSALEVLPIYEFNEDLYTKLPQRG